ncbi:MAG: response regulator [Magnetococcales bacterium]|nr:response regulator [Magnetococcales bacterium]
MDQLKMKDFFSPANQQDIKEAEILIVDDDINNISLLLEQLQEEGFQNLTTQTNPLHAVELCTHHLQPGEMRFDLILLDIMMPGLNGFEVVEQLRSRSIATPILALTARQDQQSRNKALGKGVSDFISRPFDIRELILRIEVHLKAHLNSKRLSFHNQTLDTLVDIRTSELEKLNSSLKKNYLDTIWRMAIMAEYRDNETGMHMKRMAHYSMLLAKATGMNVEDSELYLHTAPLHDIGKVDTPDNILLKPAGLNPTEWVRMRHHAEAGWTILKNHESELIQEAALIAYTHHEKWDGSGYPQQLKKEDIPLCGRIVSIADVFDALTSERPYKAPWPMAKVLDLLEQEKGLHFEPRLVDQFIKNIPQIIDIREKFTD